MVKNREGMFRAIRGKEVIEKFIKEKDKAVIICWAPWCKPCQKLRDSFERLDKEFPYVSFGWLNVDACIINLQRVCAEYLEQEDFELSQIPSILYFKENDIVMIEGFKNLETLATDLQEAF